MSFTQNLNCIVRTRINHILIFIYSDRLCRPPLGASLFPAHQLRMDAVRRLLSPYGSRFGLHFWATPCPLADGLRMDSARCHPHRVWIFKRFRRTSGGYNRVSICKYYLAMCSTKCHWDWSVYIVWERTSETNKIQFAKCQS